MALLPNATILHFVSDRAKALVNLATVVYSVPSIADCFHFKYCINKLLCLALASKLRFAKANFKEAGQKPETSVSEKYAQTQFHIDLYVETMGNISHQLHPFCKGNKTNTRDMAETAINEELYNIERIQQACQIKDKYELFKQAQKQVPDVVAVISQWEKILEAKLEQLDMAPIISNWFKGYLLPKTYWESAISRTKYKPTRERLKLELQVCEKLNENQTQPEGLSQIQIRQLRKEAINLCRKFQRASSQVEGRNGYLSLMNHNQRGFDENRLAVLTVVHNFDTRGHDAQTPAERLFGDKVKFNPLFDYICSNFGDLAIPRRRIVKC